MNKIYRTLSEAIADLQKRGFTEDYNFKEDRIESRGSNLSYSPDEFEIVEHHRFEGMSNPDDNSVIYAISGKDGSKGILVDAYGVYASPLTDELIQKLRINE